MQAFSTAAERVSQHLRPRTPEDPNGYFASDATVHKLSELPSQPSNWAIPCGRTSWIRSRAEPSSLGPSACFKSVANPGVLS